MPGVDKLENMCIEAVSGIRGQGFNDVQVSSVFVICGSGAFAAMGFAVSMCPLIAPGPARLQQ
jgi:hypothetical protein